MPFSHGSVHGIWRMFCFFHAENQLALWSHCQVLDELRETQLYSLMRKVTKKKWPYNYVEPKWGPLFWLEFGSCFGGAPTFKNRGKIWVPGSWWLNHQPIWKICASRQIGSWTPFLGVKIPRIPSLTRTGTAKQQKTHPSQDSDCGVGTQEFPVVSDLFRILSVRFSMLSVSLCGVVHPPNGRDSLDFTIPGTHSSGSLTQLHVSLKIPIHTSDSKKKHTFFWHLGRQKCSSMWLNHPSEKYHLGKLDRFPRFRDENKWKIVETTAQSYVTHRIHAWYIYLHACTPNLR